MKRCPNGIPIRCSVIDESAAEQTHHVTPTEELATETQATEASLKPKRVLEQEVILVNARCGSLRSYVLMVVRRRSARTSGPHEGATASSLIVHRGAALRGHEPGQRPEYFSDGLAEQLIHDLAKV